MIINKRLINITKSTQETKKCHTPHFVHQTTINDILYQCQSQKSMTHKFTNAQILIDLINENHENW